MRTKTPFALTAVLVAGCWLSAGALLADDGAAVAPAEGTTAAAVGLDPPDAVLDSFVAGEVKSHVYFLASKKTAGRASGTPGCDLAGEYIIEHLKEWGLEPAGEGGDFKQYMDMRVIPFPGQQPKYTPEIGSVQKTFNVLAVVRGSHPTLKDEYVVLSAHYDHVGRKNKKKYFFGADDNASGSSALLQVARAFADPDAPRPLRSILFLWCTGEERGLLGSKHYVDHPTVPLADIVCNLNIDMVGRNKSKEMHVYGNASSPDLDAHHNAAAEISGFEFLAKTGSIFLRSDQVNFYRKDIPCLFWTSGLHKDYHATSDEAKRIDTPKVSRAAKHAYVTAWRIACTIERPRFVKMDDKASSGPLGAVLDMVPAESLPERIDIGPDEGAVLVRTVMDGTPGFEAGLEQGDFIIGLDGRALPDTDPVGALEDAFAAAKGSVSLRVVRGKRKLKITVKL